MRAEIRADKAAIGLDRISNLKHAFFAHPIEIGSQGERAGRGKTITEFYAKSPPVSVLATCGIKTLESISVAHRFQISRDVQTICGGPFEIFFIANRGPAKLKMS